MSKTLNESELRARLNELCVVSTQSCPEVIAGIAAQPVGTQNEFLELLEKDIKRLVLMHRVAVQRQSPRTSNNRRDNHTAVRRSNELMRKAKLQVRALARLD